MPTPLVVTMELSILALGFADKLSSCIAQTKMSIVRHEQTTQSNNCIHNQITVSMSSSCFFFSCNRFCIKLLRSFKSIELIELDVILFLDAMLLDSAGFGCNRTPIFAFEAAREAFIADVSVVELCVLTLCFSVMILRPLLRAENSCLSINPSWSVSNRSNSLVAVGLARRPSKCELAALRRSTLIGLFVGLAARVVREGGLPFGSSPASACAAVIAPGDTCVGLGDLCRSVGWFVTLAADCECTGKPLRCAGTPGIGCCIGDLYEGESLRCSAGACTGEPLRRAGTVETGCCIGELYVGACTGEPLRRSGLTYTGKLPGCPAGTLGIGCCIEDLYAGEPLRCSAGACTGETLRRSG